MTSVVEPSAPDPRPARPAAPAWTPVDDGLWVASANGEFLGTVELRRPGAYVAVDAHGADIAVCETLDAAKQRVAPPARHRHPGRPPEARRPKAWRPERESWLIRLAATAAWMAALAAVVVGALLLVDILR